MLLVIERDVGIPLKVAGEVSWCTRNEEIGILFGDGGLLDDADSKTVGAIYAFGDGVVAPFFIARIGRSCYLLPVHLGFRSVAIFAQTSSPFQ